jgi:hypothetical protein
LRASPITQPPSSMISCPGTGGFPVEGGSRFP